MADLTGKTLGNYEIIKVLGKGGMAIVYLARQNNMKREVAVKVIESDLAQSAEFVRRFEREVDTIASFSNAHILKVFDYGKDEGLVYLVMELLRGGSLADKIRAGALPLPIIRKLLNQIASALDYAHRRGIVHRDLKPQNVMLDEDGNAFLTDFGIAKVMSGGTTITMATSAGTILGTPAYMAPEQWKSQPVDARTDIYALGIMLYEMLTGVLPFASDTAYGLMHKHVNEEPPVRSMERRFASGIERVLLKALEKNPDDRYSSSMQLVREFEAAVQRHGLTDAPYADSATQIPDGGIELIELEPLDFDDTFANRPVDADILRSGSSPMSDTHLKTGTLSLKPEGAVPPPPSTPPPAQTTTPSPQSRSSMLMIIAIVALLGLGGLTVALLNGRGNATPTTPPTAAVAAVATDAPTGTSTLTLTASSTSTPSSSPTITPSATATDEPGVQTQVALTQTERATQTLIVQASYTKTATPNRQQTAAAIIAQLDTATSDAATANAIASYTKTPTPTFTATNTATATFTFTATATATLTATLTLTPIPCVISTTETNVRAHLGPSRQRNVIGNLTPGDSYTATRQAVDSDGKTWVQITFRNQNLWVMLSDATSSGDCAKLTLFAVTNTPSATFTVTHTATPSITPPPGAVCIIITTITNVRAHLGPSRQRTPIGFLDANTPYAPLSRAVDSEGNEWVEIKLRNQNLWVMLSDVTVQGNCDLLPSAGASAQSVSGTATRTPAASPTIAPSATASATRVNPSATSTSTQTATKASTATASPTRTATKAVPTATASSTRTATTTSTASPSSTVRSASSASTATVLTVQSGACVITTKEVNSVRVHLGPSRLRNVLGYLSVDTPYPAVSRIVDADKKAWVEVKLNNKLGWVFLDDVTAQGDCVQVPTPTATVAK